MKISQDLIKKNGLVTDIETQEISSGKSQFRTEEYQKKLYEKFKGWGFDIGFAEKYHPDYGIINIVYNKNRFSRFEAEEYIIENLHSSANNI